jgi:serine/threonine-protein kinase
MRLKSGQRLGKYRIKRRLAEGGFAEVFQAYDTIEGISVALKIPHTHMTSRLLEDFRKEVRLSARLDHPNILPIKNAQFIDGVFAIVYPLGEGTLEDRMQRRMSLDTRIELAEQILEAVAFAHHRRVIHCDLKPENLILFPGHGNNGGGYAHRVRLTDFGISKLSARTVLASGSGTVGYVAPEQAMGRASFRSDVFSLGLMLWELFSGELPEWPFEWPPPGTDKLRKRVHPDFIAFLRRAIRVNQSLRFEDAQKMLASFRRLRQRGCIKPRAPINGRGKRKRPTQRNSDWKEVRVKQFERTYKKALGLRHKCGRCKGPMSEAMIACPWCGNAPKVYRGETRHPDRCPRCKRGRKLDWKYCPYCYGGAFRQVSTRTYTDRAYTERCRAPGCTRKQMAPYMRYCPWCRTKSRKAWKIAGSKHSCGRCGWGVLPDYWKFCPWCAKKQPRT